jgi:hypothetical protein
MWLIAAQYVHVTRIEYRNAADVILAGHTLTLISVTAVTFRKTYVNQCEWQTR